MEEESNVVVFIAHDTNFESILSATSQVTRLDGTEEEFTKLRMCVE